MAVESEYTGKRVLIKFGGNALSGQGDLERFGRDLSMLRISGFVPVVVHGGGPEISEEMERRGLTVRKVAGLRVTDEAGLEVAIAVLSRLNREITKVLAVTGVDARGLSGAEAGVIAKKMPPAKAVEDGRPVEVDLGRVGEVKRVRTEEIELLLSKGAVPVIYPICSDSSGVMYNVNADTVAAHVAQAIGAHEMVLLTDVPGILKGGADSREVLPTVALSQIDGLIAGGAITGGMVPKVEACRATLVKGLKVVYILNGKEPHSIVRRLVDGERIGTTITVG